MILLLPVIQFKVDYSVVGGRPYSRFEHLVLRSIEAKLTSLDALKRELCVHSRLLIEALVTLTEAGWIAVGNEGFALTVEGERSLSMGRVPESRIFRPLHSYLMIERLTGAICRNREFVTERELRDEGYWEKCVKLTPEVHSSRLDEGVVRDFLPMRAGEWISTIGPIFPVRKDGCWFAVNVDVRQKKVRGLPYAWRGHLVGRMLEAAELAVTQGMGDVEGSERPSGKRKGTAIGSDSDEEEKETGNLGVRRLVRFGREILLLTYREHEDYVLRVLATAVSTVVIVSSFIRVQSLEVFSRSIGAALARGVNIDIVWGYLGQSEGAGRVAIDWLKEFSYRQKAAPGRFRFNKSPANSHVKILLWDHSVGFEACIGSHNWLSSLNKVVDDESGIPPNTSTVIKDVALVGYVARTIAGLFSHIQGERLSGGRERLGYIASKLEEEVAHSVDLPIVPGADYVEVGLVRDLQHESLIQDLLLNSRSRLFVGSHQLGRVAELRLMAALRRSDFHNRDFRVAFGETELLEDDVSLLSKEISAVGGQLLRAPGFHSKILIGDDSCYIGSYNFLSADPFSTASRSRELGVVVGGAACADSLWSWFDRLFSWRRRNGN
jgi:hypothetical protein